MVTLLSGLCGQLPSHDRNLLSMGRNLTVAALIKEKALVQTK